MSISPTSFASQYAADLLGYLRTNGFSLAATNFAWTHHNYYDIKYQGGAPIGAQAVRARLKAAGWGGWPAGSSAKPCIMITEGGAKWNEFPDPAQGDRIVAAYNAVHNDFPSGGEGILMASNYLNVTDPTFDTGIRETQPYLYVSRDSYPKWANLPTP